MLGCLVARPSQAAHECARSRRCAEITTSISDIRFKDEGRFVVSRDYLTLKVWDVAMERAPVAVFPVHDYLRSQARTSLRLASPHPRTVHALTGGGTHSSRSSMSGTLFSTSLSAACLVTAGEVHPRLRTLWLTNGACPLARRRIVTGSYNNMFTISSMDGSSVTVEAEHDGPRKKGKKKDKVKREALAAGQVDLSSIDYKRKVLHAAFHPFASLVAVAGLNKLYIYRSG